MTVDDLQISSKLQKEIVAFTEAGAHHGCPFCIGRMISEVVKGHKIVFLKGRDAGRIATVVNGHSRREECFDVKFERQKRGEWTECSYKREEFLIFPLPRVPAWLCPLAIDDLCAVENAIVGCIQRSIVENLRPSAMLLAKALASTAWHRRIPVSGDLVRRTLEGHGFREEWRDEFSRLFDFALEVLVSNHARPPIKRKAVQAMSIGRYISQGSRENWISMFGFDPMGSPFATSAMIPTSR